MIEYINLLLLLTIFGSTCYVYYRLKKIFYLISIVMDSEILDQLTDLGRDVDSEFPKPKRGRKKKADPRVNELEDNDVRDKRERLVACVLSGNSKMYLGKECTEQQINEMDYNSINTLLNRYESVLNAQMTKSLGKSIINLYSNLCLSQFQLGTSPPGNPRGFAQKSCPGGRDLTFESCPGTGNSTRTGILWKVQTMLNANKCVLTRRFVLLVFNNFSETPCMKVGLEVRISLVSVLSTGGGKAQKKSFACKKLKAISNTDHF